MTSRRQTGVLLVLLLFTIFGFVRHLHVPGEDLSSSYVGCLVLAAGEHDHLYDHDTELFNVQDDPSWTEPAARSGFPADIQLHPYVQTPLWAFSLRPLCTRMSFPAFNCLFLLLVMLSFSGTLWLVLRYWTPELFHPGWAALLCLGLYLSEPFRYALFLNQTHILFLFLTVAALVSARRYPILAGLLLAVAAAVKITPGFLLLYWLCTRQRKAALSFVLSSVALAALTLLAVGPNLLSAYLHELAEVSDVLLVAFNNQSLAAWLLAHTHPEELFVWRIYPLGTAAKLASMLFCIGSSILGGLLDRRSDPAQPASPPVGAVIAMLGATMGTPIAWTHYFILLLLPITLMLAANRRRRSPLLLALVVAIYLLNLYPVSIGSILEQTTAFSVVRSQWYAGLLSLIGLILLHRRAADPRTRASQRKIGKSLTATRHPISS